MVDAQSLYFVGFVSQATFALTMTLLAWSDRRSRGMTWLAAASGLQLLATASRYLLRTAPGRVSEAVGSCLLVLIFFFAYMGLRWYVVRRDLRTWWGPGLTGAAIVLVIAVSFVSLSVAMAISRLTVSASMAVTLMMLWRTENMALRLSARIAAFQLGLVLGLFIFRLWVDEATHGQTRVQLSVYGREGTLITISLLSLSFIALFVAEAKRRLHEETRTDSLTGLCNRRAMEEFAEQAIEAAHASGAPLSLLMLDMDNFKALNDTWGHWLGDRALHALGSVLLTGTGTRDITARMGGEEFAVLLPERDAQSAVALAERLRAAVEDLRLNEAECDACLTVSIGVSLLRPGERTWADMLRRADKALYRAKREGRNRVVLHSDEIASMLSDVAHGPLRSPAFTGAGGNR